MTVDTAIRVQGLEKSFKDLHVLRGVDFDVAPGSIFALLGSNGAGKTTVVRILSTLLTADAGTATVHGFDVAAEPGEVRESISLTGQFAAVDEILTGRENLVLVARLRHLADAGPIAERLLARFQLTDAADRKVSTYSGGMRRRLDIAMSLIGDPPVVFLDEPTTGLDPEARLEVWQAVRDLAASGTTVLLTTQYLDEAEQLADRIAILHEGRIIENGTLAELKALLPPAKVEYVEKQPTLEDVFLALVGDDDPPRTSGGAPMTTHFFGDTALLTGRSLRHITRSLDTIITTTIMPIALHAALRVRLRRRDRHRVGLVRELPAARHPDHHGRVGRRVHGVPALPRPAERHLRAVPLDADRPVVACSGPTCSPRWSPTRSRSWSSWSRPSLLGFRSGAGVLAWLAVAGILALFTLALTWLAVIPGPDREVGRRCERVLLPADPPAVHQLGVRADGDDARPGARLRREPAGDLDRRRDPRPAGRAAGRQRHLGGARLVRGAAGRRLRLRDARLPPPARLTLPSGRPTPPAGPPVTPPRR